MSVDLTVCCACGALSGCLRRVSASSGNRVLCYCDDCQSFAHFLGDAARILDRQGGTDIFQTSPARLELARGRDELVSMRLRPDGLIRWYTRCCRTPIGNAPAYQIPFVGLILACLDPALDARARDAALGPVRARVMTKFATGEPALRNSGVLPALARFAKCMLVARVRGDHRHSPFFDPDTGAPTVAPHVLSADELAAIRPRD